MWISLLGMIDWSAIVSGRTWGTHLGTLPGGLELGRAVVSRTQCGGVSLQHFWQAKLMTTFEEVLSTRPDSHCKRNSGLGPDWLLFWSTACPTHLFSTKLQAMMQPNCQCKWSASLPVIIISFLLCLIVALAPSTSVGFPDPGMPVFLREDNTERA